VSQRNTGVATDYFAELQSLSSPHGNSMQRMAHYFMEALVSKIHAKKMKEGLGFCSLNSLTYLLQGKACYVLIG